MPITADTVSTWLGLQPGQAGTTMPAVVDAVNAYVSALPVVTESANPAVWSDSVTLGANMLAARMWRRRNSPGGVEAITEAGATYVARSDVDIARLLKIDALTAPQIG